MNRSKILAGLCILTMSAVCSSLASAEEVKEKPPMYSYVGNWAIPRAQWAEMAKDEMNNQKMMDKAMSSGAIIGYGSDTNLVHEADGSTHDEWWSSMSLAGVLNVIDQAYKSGSSTSPVLESSTKHWDNIYVSRYYNWHPGSWKDVYSHVSVYKLKADAPQDALDNLSKNMIVPFMEKMLADGSIHEYEIDTESIHSHAPGMFTIVYIAANAEALDKVGSALRDSLKASPMNGPAFGSMTDSSEHRDYLTRTNATYK